MDQFTIRQTSAQLPVFDAEADLEPLSRLGGDGGFVCDFQFGDATVPALELAGVLLRYGRIRAVQAERTRMTAVRLDCVEFTGCDLSSARWTGGKISQTRFDGCKFLAARFDGVTMEHVVFTGCKLDYAALDQARATGPVVFAGCSLREGGTHRMRPGRFAVPRLRPAADRLRPGQLPRLRPARQ